MSYARSPRPDFSMTMGMSWSLMLMGFSLRPFDDLQFVALGVAEADDPAAAGGDARIRQELNTPLLQVLERLLKIGHPQREVPKARGEPGHGGGLGPLVPGRH